MKKDFNKCIDCYINVLTENEFEYIKDCKFNILHELRFYSSKFVKKNKVQTKGDILLDSSYNYAQQTFIYIFIKNMTPYEIAKLTNSSKQLWYLRKKKFIETLRLKKGVF